MNNLRDIRTAKSRKDGGGGNQETPIERKMRHLFELVMDRVDELEARSYNNQRLIRKLLKKLSETKLD